MHSARRPTISIKQGVLLLLLITRNFMEPIFIFYNWVIYIKFRNIKREIRIIMKVSADRLLRCVRLK